MRMKPAAATALLALLCKPALAEDAPELSDDDKCTAADTRTFHGCFEVRLFDPSARIYFDTGSDDPGEIDVFQDGNLTPTIDMVSFYWPWRLDSAAYYDDWSWGPTLGLGISGQAQDSEDGTRSASSAPVVMLSYGLMLERRFEGSNAFAIELGRSIGVSSDETLSDITDSAIYFGLKFRIEIGGRETAD